MASANERNPIRKRGLKMIPWSNHEEWLQIRRGYLGGTDAGPIVGLSPYNSAFSVWAEKTGQVPEFAGNISTRVGTYLEDLVAKLFMEETGKQVQRLNFTLVNPAYPFACANIDREVLGEDALLEIKTTTSLGAIKKFRSGDFPEQWYSQVVHYLAVTGAKTAYLAALENNRELRIFTVERDEDEIKALMEAEREFWDTYVVPKKAPPADGHSATTETIKKLYSEEAGEGVDLSGFETMLEERKALKGQQEALKSEIDRIDNSIKLALESHPEGSCGRFRVSWKLQNTAGLDREKIKADFPELDFAKYATQSRVFRVTERKAKG